MQRLLTGPLSTNLGAKYMVAVTGILLALFVLAHMLGNLLVFSGPDALNAYAQKLKDLGPLLWVARLGLLATLIVHIGFIVRLAKLNQEARPVNYREWRPIQSTLPSRTMIMTGVVILAFVIYHLLHFTLGVTHPEHFALRDSQGRHDVYAMVILGFRQSAVFFAYLGAQLLLGLHLSHGVGSLFQTMGWNTPRYAALTACLGRAFAAAIVLGNVAMPLAAWAGWLPYPVEVN